jgi:hypothetical protein
METGMAEKSSWDQANIRQKLALVWRNGKKLSQIIKDYFYLPFFLLIILWTVPREQRGLNSKRTAIVFFLGPTKSLPSLLQQSVFKIRINICTCNIRTLKERYDIFLTVSKSA